MTINSLRDIGKAPPNDPLVKDVYSTGEAIRSVDLAKSATKVPAFAAPNPELGLAENAAAIRAAQDAVANYGLPADVATDPSFVDILGASFRQENVVTNLMMRAFEDENQELTPLTPEQLFDLADGDGIAQHFGAIGGARTVGEYETRKARLMRELDDRNIMAASGVTGFATSMVAGILDVTTLLPFGAATRGLTGLKAVGGIAAAAGADAAISEAALQGFQTERTLEESVSAVALSAVLGGAIGAAVHVRFGTKIADMVDARAVEAQRILGSGRPMDAGSAANLAAWDVAQQLNPAVAKSKTIELQSMRALDNVPGWVGDQLRNPFRALSFNASSPAARQFADGISSRPWLNDADVAGVTTGKTTVSVEYNKVTAQAADVIHVVDDAWGKVNGAYNGDKDAFERDVFSTVISGDPHVLPAVNAAADKARGFFESIKKGLIDIGVFDDNLKVKTANHYAPVIYDVEAVRSRQNEFIALTAQAIRKELDEEFAQANLTWTKEKLQVEENRRIIKEDMTQARENTAEELRRFDTEFEAELERLRTNAADDIEGAKQRLNKSVELASKVTDFDAFTKSVTERRRAEVKLEFATRRLELTVEQAGASVLGDAAKVADIDVRLDTLDAAERMRLGELKQARKSIKESVSDEIKEWDATIKDDAAWVAKETSRIETRLTQRIKKTTTKNTKLRAEYKADLDAIDKDIATKLSELRTSTKKPDILRNTPADMNGLAQDRARGIYDTLIGNTSRFVDPDTVAAFSNYRKGRTNPTEHKTLADARFVKTNVLDLMEHYGRTAGMDLALGTVFKKTKDEIVKGEDGKAIKKKGVDGKVVAERRMVEVADIKLDGVKTRITEDYKVLIDNVDLTPKQKSLAGRITDPVGRNVFEEKARGDNTLLLTTERDKAIRDVEAMRLLLRGGQSDGLDGKAWASTAEVVGIFNFVRLMGGTVASSLGDPVNIMLSNGFGRALKYGITPMLRDFRGAFLNADGPARQTTRLLAQNLEREMNRTVLDIADIGSPLARDKPGLDRMRRLSAAFSKYTGIQAWNSLWRQVAGRTVQGRVLEHAETGWGNLSADNRAWLTNNKITPERLQGISDAWNAQATKYLPDGGVYPDVEKWPEAARQSLFQVASQEAANNIVAPQAIDKMSLAVHPGGRLILQFRTHMLANQLRLIGRQRQLAKLNRGHAAQVYTGLFTLVAMGVLVDFLKFELGDTTVTGQSKGGQGDKWLNEWENNPVSSTFNAMDRSGILGILLEGDNMVNKAMGLGFRSTAQYVAGESATQSSRTRNKPTVEVLFGPTAGVFQNAADALAGASAAATGGDVQRYQTRAARALIPAQNAPFIQQILSEGEREIGTMYDVQ